MTLPSFVSAAPSAGIKPGNFFYFFDTTFEKIGLFFTFNPEKKAQKAMEYAEEKLAEAEAVANENNPKAVATAMANYQKDVSLATNESKIIEDKTKAENLLSTIADNTSKHQEVLAEVLNKVPDEAKEAITKAIEVSKKGQEEAMKQIAELKKEVSELKQEIKKLEKKLKDEEGKLENNGDRKKDEVKEIDSLKDEIENLKKELPQTSINTTNIVTLPSGAVVEMDTNGSVVKTIKEAPQQNNIAPNYTLPAPTQNQSQDTVQSAGENISFTPVQPIDASPPNIWEAQFGEQIRTQIPELSTWAPRMIRLATNELVDISKTKFRFRSPIRTEDLKVTFNIISKNIARGPTDTCYVNCDKGGYYSTFFLEEPLVAKIPLGASVPGSYDFEFLVVDLAGNYSVQWHSARDIAKFIYE